MIIQICVGSSCHLKGSADIIELFQKSLAEHQLENDVVLSGSFCLGVCNREGVTVQIDDDVHLGITRENFHEFFKEKVLNAIQNEGK